MPQRIKKTIKNNIFTHKLYTKFKSLAIEGRIRREESYYKKRAVKYGIQVEQGKALENALKKRLSKRGIFPSEKNNKDVNILYVSNIGNNSWEGHQVLPALRQFGKVTVISFAEWGFHPEKSDWELNKVSFNMRLLEHVCMLQRKEPFDVMITYCTGHEFLKSTVQQIGDLGIVVVSYHWDDRAAFKGKYLAGNWTGPYGLVGPVDLSLTNSSSSLVKYFVEGGLALFWPEGADPKFFHPREQEFEVDVSFIGANYGKRNEYIRFLQQNGIQVATFGYGWDRGFVSNEGMPEIYWKSRINLGFSGIQYSMRESCLKGRDFEVPMSGAVYLTSEHPDLHKVYSIDREIVTYQDKRDILQKARFLLNNPDKCAQIRKAARERCLRDHTWERRFQDVFEILGFRSSGAGYCEESV